MAKKAYNVTFKSSVNIVKSRVAGALSAAQTELTETAVEWVQDKMLYGYKDPHGEDRHTEIYDTYREDDEPHMIDTISANAKRASQNTYTVEVGTPKTYAVFVHNGTRKLKGRPFLRDALMDHQTDIDAIVAKHATEKGL